MSKKEKKYIDNSVKNFKNELKIRREKLHTLRQQGFSFPSYCYNKNTSDKLHTEFDLKSNKELELLNIEVSVAGRIMRRRIMGKASFVVLQDIGGRIQLYISHETLSSQEVYDRDFKKLDLGDIISVRGKLFKTQTNELSISCKEIRLLTKSLRPLPDKFYGLRDQEIRYRQRYLDLIINDKSRNIFKIRSKIITNIRQFMIKHNFMEVETPMMQIIPGGASARPFITHHNALDIDMYLRIAPELHLKRLIIGGFDRIFEINRSFRNEGISINHNPEFTMMELYMAYANYKDLIKLLESMLQTLAQDILGTTKILYGNKILDFSKPFTKLTIREAIKKYLPEINMTDLDSCLTAQLVAKKIGIKVEKHWRLGHIILEIFERVVEKHLIQPTFITEYPVEVSPLARRNDKNPEVTDRFEFYIAGREIGNGFNELNDSEDQEQRFKNQINMKVFNKNQTMFYDEDYITALEYGLPPTAGLGIGIDRMVMIFTNTHTIRDVIFFPTMRPA